MKSHSYELDSEWVVDAPLVEVRSIIEDMDALDQWWPAAFLHVTRLSPCSANRVGARARLITSGWMPYLLRWEMEVIEDRGEAGFTFRATGDFVGTGAWEFETRNGRTWIRFKWNICADKLLLRRLSWALRPLFISNHRWAMDKGIESLLLEIERRRGRRVSAPPQPTWTPGFRRSPITAEPKVV